MMMREIKKNRILIIHDVSFLSKSTPPMPPLPSTDVIAIIKIPINKKGAANLTQEIKTSLRRKKRIILIINNEMERKNKGSPILINLSIHPTSFFIQILKLTGSAKKNPIIKKVTEINERKTIIFL